MAKLTTPTSDEASSNVTEWGELRHGSPLQLPGHDWVFLAQSDERVLLRHQVDGLQQLVVLDVTGDQARILEQTVAGSAWYSEPQAVVAKDEVFRWSPISGLTRVGGE